MPFYLNQLLPLKFHQEIIENSFLQKYSKGQLIISELERDDRIRYIQSGWISLSKAGKAVALLDSGFQTHDLHSDEPAVLTSYSIHAVNDALIYSMPRQLFRQAILSGGEHSVLSSLKVASAVFKTLLFYTYLKDDRPLEIRLAEFYWHIGHKMKDGSRKIPDSISQKVISSLLNASREEVNRRKKLLVNSGFIVKYNDHEYLNPVTPLLIG